MPYSLYRHHRSHFQAPYLLQYFCAQHLFLLVYNLEEHHHQHLLWSSLLDALLLGLELLEGQLLVGLEGQLIGWPPPAIVSLSGLYYLIYVMHMHIHIDH